MFGFRLLGKRNFAKVSKGEEKNLLNILNDNLGDSYKGFRPKIYIFKPFIKF